MIQPVPMLVVMLVISLDAHRRRRQGLGRVIAVLSSDTGFR